MATFNVTTFPETNEALDALQVEITELLAFINARPTRRELTDAIAAMNATVAGISAQMQTMRDQVDGLERAVNSLATELNRHINES